MKESFKFIRHWALLALLTLVIAVPSIAMAEQPAATLSPQPTTLGQTTEKTSPTLYFMLIGACIILGGGLAIFMRYSK